MAQVLRVPATIDITDNDKSSWAATGVAAPFDGIFSIGNSFTEARQAFAEVVALGVTSGTITVDGMNPADVVAVRVMATTRKTFLLDDLNPKKST